MKLRHLLALLVATPLWACGERAPSSGPAREPGSSATDSQPSGDLAFAIELLGALGTAKPREDLPAARAEEERAYTQKWLNLALRPSLRARTDSGRMRFVSELGARGDDAVVATWTLGGRTVDVIDGRTLVFAVHVTAEGPNVEELWRALFQDERVASPGDIEMLPLGTASGAGLWGTVRPAKPPAGWFPSPVQWCRLRDRAVFVFEKRLEAPRAKGPKGRWIPEGDAARYIGGTPISDPRPYLRFEPTNRVTLAAEWAREINGADQPLEGPAYGARIGKPPSTPPKLSGRSRRT